MLVEIVLFLVTSVVGYILYCHRRIYKFLREKDVKFIMGPPVFGNAFGTMTNTKHIIEELVEIYNAFPNERYVAYVEGNTPIILIRDPELIKAITVKNFEHFVDHKELFPEAGLLGMSVLGMKGDRWRNMRTTLTPAFTGSKMRLMLPSMMEVAGNTVKYLKEHADEEIDVSDVIRRYTNDVIASTSFGLEVNSFKDKNNEFYRLGQTIFELSLLQNYIMFLPSLAKKFGMKFLSEKTITFFRDIVVNTMEYRAKNNVERPDMIQILMEASKEWELDELVGQVFFFFSAGFETTASTLVPCIHELVLNEEVQQKLYEEVKDTNDLTYEKIGKLKYLDCVLNETMRKWSVAIFMDRICVKPYELPPPHEGGKPYLIKPGEVVYNTVNAIHLDAKYYPDPMKFIPERFSDENKHNIAPFTFMPFGMGPRNCIGSRLALIEMKVLLFSLILNLKITKSERTSTVMKLKPDILFIRLDKKTFVKFEPRNQK